MTQLDASYGFALDHPVFDPERQITPDHFWLVGRVSVGLIPRPHTQSEADWRSQMSCYIEMANGNRSTVYDTVEDAKAAVPDCRSHRVPHGPALQRARPDRLLRRYED